jgi:hypothetical protein
MGCDVYFGTQARRQKPGSRATRQESEAGTFRGKSARSESQRVPLNSLQPPIRDSRGRQAAGQATFGITTPAGIRQRPTAGHDYSSAEEMTSCPVDTPSDWAGLVNQRIDPLMLESVQLSLKRGRPHGTERWPQKTARQLGLESTLHDPWRPKKKKARKRKRTRRTK